MSSEVDLFQQLSKIFQEGGTITALVAVVVAIWKKILVPGWIYDACSQRNAELEAIANSRADKLETKLDRIEQERWRLPEQRREIP